MCNIVPTPIGFYSQNDFTYLIHATDWNRLDITCLETDELITDRIVDYDTDTNYADYFLSELSVSPDQKSFISNGWVWHPFGMLTKYDIATFLNEYEPSSIPLGLPDSSGYLWDRPFVWITSDIIAVGYNKQEAEKGQYPSELIFIDIHKDQIIKHIEFDGFEINNEYGEISGALFHDDLHQHLITVNKQKGLTITDYAGGVLFKDENFQSMNYSAKHNLFWRINKRTLFLSEIIKD